MSRPALIVCLARVLQRQPTPEEYETARATIREFCSDGWLYVSGRVPVAPTLAQEVAELRAQGMTWRAIARRLGIDKERARACLKTQPIT